MKWKEYNELLQDERGRILGKVRTYRRQLSAAERQACTNFLRGIDRVSSKDETMNRTKQQPEQPKVAPDKCNIVYLAGVIETLKVTDDSAFLLVDSGPDKKYVPCTVYKSVALADKISAYREGDLIRLVGYVRPWSRKNEVDEWQNSMDVRITEVREKEAR